MFKHIIPIILVSCHLCQAEIIVDDFTLGEFDDFYDNPIGQSFEIRQDVTGILGDQRLIRFGTVAGSADKPDPVIKLTIGDGKLNFDSDIGMESFTVQYGQLDRDPNDGIDEGLGIDLTGQAFVMDFGHYHQAPDFDLRRLGIGVRSGAEFASQFSGLSVPLSQSDNPFSVTIPMSALTGDANLTAIDNFGFSIGVAIGGGTSFELRSIRIVPEPTGLLGLIFSLFLIRRGNHAQSNHRTAGASESSQRCCRHSIPA